MRIFVKSVFADIFFTVYKLYHAILGSDKQGLHLFQLAYPCQCPEQRLMLLCEGVQLAD